MNAPVTGWEQVDAGPRTGVQCGQCHDTVRFYSRHQDVGIRCGRCLPGVLTPHTWRARREQALTTGLRELTGGKPVAPQVHEAIWRALGRVWSAGVAAGPCPGRAATPDPFGARSGARP